MEKDSQSKDSRKKPHDFTNLPGFSDAMQKLANVPKAAVESRERTEKRKARRA
jgi:hypothetical protein